MIELILAGAAAFGGHVFVKKFVRERLRFVDGVQKRGVPLAVGLASAAAVAIPIAILPFMGTMTMIVFGVAVGTGVAAGRRDIKRLPSP